MANNVWVQVSNIGPSARAGHKMVYDSDRKVIVLFGGNTGTACLSDTWEWDGNVWTQVANTGPDKRYLHVMSYDSSRKKTVLFGGYLFPFAGQAEVFYTDTWEWDGALWTKVAENGIKNLWPAMAYDANAKKSILYGNNVGVNDATLAWDGNEWKELSVINPASIRKHDMCFNTVTNTIILYGGVSSGTLSDTWEWDGAFWKQLSDFGPKPLLLHAMAFNGKNVVLFGGATVENVATAVNETWQWDGKHWSLTQYFGPAARISHAMCADTIRNKVVFFGGATSEANDATFFSDTWELDNS